MGAISLVGMLANGQPNVFLGENGVVLTSSKAVAEGFEKEHKHVLEAIDKLMETGGGDFHHLYYQEVRAFDPAANRETRSFNMTRDGFTLLAMGFTGEKALPGP